MAAPIKQGQGYAVNDVANWTKFDKITFDLKTPEPTDVDIDILACGVCGSDVHTINGGWGDVITPCIPGHEIVGIVTRIGEGVTDPDIKVGARVGVGAQVGSCMKCANCKSDNENYCITNLIDTYNARWPNGVVAQGGYATHIRTPQQFVFAIPEGVPTNDAASSLCAGLTVWSPLLRNGVTKGTKVGVVGLGGLGHWAVLFAVALGAEVTVISHSPSKREDALKMGAHKFISTKEEPEWFKPYSVDHPLDVIISTASSNAIDLPSILSALGVHGKCVFVGMPEDELKGIRAQDLSINGCFLGSSHIGSKVEAIKMLDLIKEKKIKPWVEILPMSECSSAVQRVHKNDVKYRFVMNQDIVDHGHGDRSHS
ncbi:unnamed protein product [Sympodiomycopsis kandeliae]